ncbi:MAG: Nramp family divalent metal transporter [Bryobacteraceae bacterium]|nr:Nramp family divalent metal transporter [Bryobacteraceae bacterium]
MLGPQDLLTNSAAGAGYGYSMLWTLAIIIIARYVMLEATARYVVVTGETLMAGYARAGRWVVWLISLSIILKRHVSALYLFLLLGGAAHLLLPLPTAWSEKIWGLIFWWAGFAITFWGRYRFIEKISKPFAVILGGSLAVAAVMSRPDLGAAAQGLFLPSVPGGEGAYSYLFVLMALAGSSAGSLSNLKYASFVHERGWRDPVFLQKQRFDLMTSTLALFAMLALTQITAAATLFGSGVKLDGIQDLAPMFSVALGDAGRIVLALSLWAACFTTLVGANTGYGLLVSDIWHNVLRRSPDADAGEGFGERPAYRWAMVWFTVTPLYVIFTDWKAFWLTLLAAAIFVVLLPVLVFLLLWLTNNKKLMGAHANGWLTNAILGLVILASSYLTYQSGVEVAGKIRAAW